MLKPSSSCEYSEDFKPSIVVLFRQKYIPERVTIETVRMGRVCSCFAFQLRVLRNISSFLSGFPSKHTPSGMITRARGSDFL